MSPAPLLGRLCFHRNDILAYVIERLGIPESDVRMIVPMYDRYCYRVTEWNRRTHTVTAADVVEWWAR